MVELATDQIGVIHVLILELNFILIQAVVIAVGFALAAIGVIS